ncbi:MAG: DUF935 domain-containing protein, partial [Rhodocyclaceae bacterium]|nr:DUF935 domain-containing protein [Rhodocyclaceae bacterium]
LSQAGMPIPHWWVRERFGIPEAAAGEAVLSATPNGAVAIPDVAQQTRAVHALHATRATPDQDLAARVPELMSERMAIEAAPAWGEIMDEVKRLVDAADSLEGLRDALLAAFGDLPTGRLAEVMAMGFAAAELAGRFAVEVDGDAGGSHGR